MATRWIHSGWAVPDGVHDKAGFAVDTNGNLGINRGPDFQGMLSSDPGTEFVPVQRFITVTDTTTLTEAGAPNGSTIVIDAETTKTVTLPAATTKYQYTFITSSDNTVAHYIDPAGSDGVGGSIGVGQAALTFVDGKYLSLPAAVGAAVTILADGVADWYITACNCTAAKQS